MNTPGRSWAGQPRSVDRFAVGPPPSTFAGINCSPSRLADSFARRPAPSDYTSSTPNSLW